MSPVFFIFVLFLVEFGVCRSYVQDKRREDGIHRLVYKGNGVSITAAPYMAIYNLPRVGPLCGASIVNERSLVFAAHCVHRLRSEFAYVTVGTDKINGGDRYEVGRTFVHPKFDNETLDYDIAVLKLTQSLVFSDRVRPIKLSPKNMEFKSGDMMMSMGFGETEGDSGGPLVYKGFLVGVVSFGAGCGIHPGVYARVSALRTFIEWSLDQ